MSVYPQLLQRFFRRILLECRGSGSRKLFDVRAQLRQPQNTRHLFAGQSDREVLIVESSAYSGCQSFAGAAR